MVVSDWFNESLSHPLLSDSQTGNRKKKADMADVSNVAPYRLTLQQTARHRRGVSYLVIRRCKIFAVYKLHLD